MRPDRIWLLLFFFFQHEQRLCLARSFCFASSCLFAFDFGQFFLSKMAWVKDYRTLHSYKLFWAVCHLFPQRWQTLTYSVSGNHWPGGPRDMLKLRPCVNSSPTFGATYKTRIFYKYVVFKYPCSLSPNFFAAATHSLQHESTGERSNYMDGPRRHSKYTLTMWRFPVSEKLPVSNLKKDILNM